MLIYHLDFNYTSRKIDFVRAQLDFAATHGYNGILWELEDQVRWRTCPECSNPDSWTQDEFRELLAYSRRLELEPIPLLQTVGHAEYVMKHPAYHSFREDPQYYDCYCTSNPEVKNFIGNWINEYCELFGDLKYFHLGGDEAYRFGSCPTCSKLEPNKLYGEYIGDISETLLKNGIRPGIWSDMILNHRESIGHIPRNFIIWDWNYQAKYEFESSDFLNEKGFEVIVCSAARSSVDGPFVPEVAVHAQNVLNAELKRQELGLLGHCVTSWSLRLNPIQAGQALLTLPAMAMRFPGITHEESARKAFADSLGFAEGWEAALALGECDSRIRILSAVQWNGLKDAVPAPEGYIADWIQKWIETNEQYWFERRRMFETMLDSVSRGLEKIRPFARFSRAAEIWCEAGELESRYLYLLLNLFSEPSRISCRDFEELDILCMDFFSKEATPRTARMHTGLLLKPLIDFWRNPVNLQE